MQSRELLGLLICVCSSLCTTGAHNTAQNRPGNFHSCPPDNHHCSNDIYLRETLVQVRDIVTLEDKQEITCNLANSTITDN